MLVASSPRGETALKRFTFSREDATQRGNPRGCHALSTTERLPIYHLVFASINSHTQSRPLLILVRPVPAVSMRSERGNWSRITMPVRAVVKNPYDANSADFTIRKKSVTVQQKVGNNYPFSGGQPEPFLSFSPPPSQEYDCLCFCETVFRVGKYNVHFRTERSSVTFLLPSRLYISDIE